MKPTLKNGPSAMANGLRGAGARDESSVLFSLGALMAKGEAEEARGPGAARDESGLIDIKALAAAAAREPAKSSVASPPQVHIDIFPFEAPLPAPTPINEVAPVEAIGELPAKTTSRRGLFVAGALLIGAAAAAIGIGLSGTGTPALAAADSVGAVAEVARLGTVAVPPPAAAPSQADAKTPAPPQNQPQNPTRLDPRPQRTPSPTPTTPQPTATAKKVENTKPPVADPCGGDLMCAMRRAAEKR